MKIIDCKQGSTEWAQARCGVVTASEVGALVTPLWKIRTGEGVQTYLHTKLAERVMGYVGTTGGTWAMEQGRIVETIAVPWYAFSRNMDVQAVGFCLSDDGRIGCSPDGLIGIDGGIEVKSPQPAKHIEYLLSGIVPPAYLPQIQMSLLVTGRKWWDFVSYHRFIAPLVVRVYPDPTAQAALGEALANFLVQLDKSLTRLQPMLAQQGRA